jgi:hypothetical protein
LINVKISGYGSAGIGAAIYRSGETTLAIVNSIVFHNFVAGTQEDPRDDDLIYNGSDGLDATPLLIESSLIERGCPEQDGVSCRDVSPDDPKFLSKLAPGDLPSTSGDFQLWFTSPAIDAGNSYYLPSDVQNDLDGQDRIVQKRIDSDGFGGNGWLDLGALERQIPVSAPNRSIAFDLRNEAVDISVDIETDLDGRPSGTIDVSVVATSDREGPRVQLLASGVGVPWALEAAELLREDWGVHADVWSVTSWTELRRDALDAEHDALVDPAAEPRVPYVTQKLQGTQARIWSGTMWS